MSLKNRLHQLDGKSYGAYKSLKGRHALGAYELFIDRVQSDPYAPPSSIRVRCPFDQFTSSPRAAADYLTRRVSAQLPRGSKKDGSLSIDQPGQQVLERTSVMFEQGVVEIRLEAALPADGRRIRGRSAAHLMTTLLPQALDRAVDVDPVVLTRSAELVLDQEFLRSQLKKRGLVAFVADGSVLPRRSGDSDLPLEDAVPFTSPESLSTSFSLPSGREITGMGIPEGITVIAGGGFNGKSTLLRALQSGVYDHVENDGREFSITVADACSIRAEDGRAVTQVDISPFITNLPTGTDTSSFSTRNASGSTSQAAWLVECLDAGASTLLIDEDTSATNFMIRDERMRALVPDDREPITPFIQRVSDLYRSHGISTVLVTGGTSQFLDVADQVIVMDDYTPIDATDQARALAQPLESARPYPSQKPRYLNIDVAGRKPPQAKGLHHIRIDRNELDLLALEQLVHPSQTRAIAQLLPQVQRLHHLPLREACEEAVRSWNSSRSGRLAKPRAQELYFAASHLRRA